MTFHENHLLALRVKLIGIGEDSHEISHLIFLMLQNLPSAAVAIAFLRLNLIAIIGVAPITQVRHVHNKISNIQGRSLNVIKVIFHTMRNCS